MSRQLLILDLDETLFHATQARLERAADFRVVGSYFAYKRPAVGEFLEYCFNHFDVAVWSSATADYAREVVDNIFVQNDRLVFLWARERCTWHFDARQNAWHWLKDLRKVKRFGYPLERILVVDDSGEKHARQYGNLIRVTPYEGDESDRELLDLMRYLSQLETVPNIRLIEKRNWQQKKQSEIRNPKSEIPMSFPSEFHTHFERTNFLESPNYDETVAYFAQFERTHKAHLFTFGMSPQGRALKCLVVAGNHEFTPQDARASGKVVVLIQNGIHAGEIEGNDACMLMVREMLVENTLAQLMQNVILLVVPIINVDGHERRSEFNRPNQNGPKLQGWRTTSWNLNLNRDYMKADTPEMRALLSLYRDWQPDFFIDNHTTNGADYQYHITYGIETHANIDTELARWGNAMLMHRVLARVEQQGFIVGPFLEMVGARLEDGLLSEPMLPRYSSGYAAAHNRLMLLVETHSLKPFATRVFATKAMNTAALEFVNANYAALKNLNYYADSHTVHDYRHDRKPFPLVFTRTDESEPMTFRGFESHDEESDITLAPVTRFSDTPIDMQIPLFNKSEVEATVDVPFAFAIPREFAHLAEILALHGIDFKVMQEPESLTVERYRFVDFEFASRPYEGRQRVSVKVEKFLENVRLPEGTFIVYTQQKALRVILHLLEPESPDSFVQWGFFNAFFERKEYAEAYIMEPQARQMLASDVSLREEFFEKVSGDEDFSEDPGLRLDFFYRRSPYFDKAERVYPILRLPHKG